MDFGRRSLVRWQLINLLQKYDVLEFHVPVNDPTVVAVVESGGQLQHDLGDFALWHLSIRKTFPIFIQLATCQVLHYHNQLLLLRFRNGI